MFWAESQFGLEPLSGTTYCVIWWVKSQLLPTEGTLSWLTETLSVPSVLSPNHQCCHKKRDTLSCLPGRPILCTSALNRCFDLWLLRVDFCCRHFGNMPWPCHRPCCCCVQVSRWQTNSCQILVVKVSFKKRWHCCWTTYTGIYWLLYCLSP